MPTGYAQNFLIKKNLAKEATAQAIGELRGKQKSEEKAHAEMLAEAKKLKQNWKQKKQSLSLSKKLVQTDEHLGQLLTRRLQKNCKNNLVLKLINATFKFNHQFEQLV